MNEAAAALLRMNLAASAAVLLVLALRTPARRLFGARVAYALWWLAPAAAAAMLIPPRVVTVLQPIPSAGATPIPPLQAAAGAPAAAGDAALPWLAGAWLAGLVVSAGWLAASQLRFVRAMRAGRAGPAVIGVLRPRIVVPDDFETRYSPRERQLILAHERGHIDGQDPRINALLAAARCLAWFNPMAHLAGRYLRIDQELACDAAVIARHPKGRRAYAEAMLKAQLASQPLPLGCHWRGSAARPLEQRIALLARPQPGPLRLAGGALAVLAAASAVAGGAWTLRPPAVRTLPIPWATWPGPPAPLAASPAPALPAAERPPRAADAAPPPREALALPPPPPPPPAPPAPAIEAEAMPPTEAPARLLRVRTVARPSHVEPGSAVRVVASLTEADGRRLLTDLTAFGSQAAYRTGDLDRGGARRALFTTVDQRGEELWVTVSLGKAFAPETSGTIVLRPGETGTLRLPDGQAVTVSAFVRAETPDEAEAGARWIREQADRDRDLAERRRLAEPRRLVIAELDPGALRCGRVGAIC